MKITWKKTLAVLFAVLMLVGALSACGNKKGPSNETETKKDNDSTTPVEEVTDRYVKDDIPDTLKYNNEEFHLLCDSGQYNKSFVTEPAGDVVSNALYHRYIMVQDRLDIAIIVDQFKGAWAGMDDFINQTIQMGDTCDLVLAYNLTPGLMANQGLLCDMNKTAYLNFEKPWWSDTLMESVSVNGKVFFTGDNSSWNNLRNMLGIYVDKQLFTNYHPDKAIDDLYDSVEAKEWTMDQLFELARGVYLDTDADSAVSSGDTFGFSISSNNWIEAFFYGAGLKVLQQDNVGDWEMTLGSIQVGDFVDYFKGKFYSSESYAKDAKQHSQFKDGRAMLYLSSLSMAEQGLEQLYTVLPMPMYKEDQGRYYTHMSNTYDMYGIPKAVGEKKDRSSAVLECLASEAYRQIAPAYFETYLKVQKASDARMQDMYDIIRESLVFDMGYCFTMALDISGNQPIYFVRRALHGSSGYENLSETWASNGDGYLTLWNELLVNLENAG